MDVFRVSDKQTRYANDRPVSLNLQHEASSFNYKDTEIHRHSKNGVLGYYPFTYEQMKELERQAMIYKYMMASLPVPFDLLVSFTSSPTAVGKKVTGDTEPGRCRRTDGKKWRCSRDVAPDHKYCERHLNRGRPRSRKLVEPSLSPIHHRLPYARPCSAGCNNDGGSPIVRDHRAVPILSLSSTSNQTPYMVCPMEAPAEEMSTYRNFIDVWSESATGPDKHCSTRDSDTTVSINQNLSFTSLDLSVGGNKLMDDEMGWIQMSLGLNGSRQEYGYGSSSMEMPGWHDPAVTPGGPLAEILRQSPIFSSSGAGDKESSCLAVPTPSSSTSGGMKRRASLSDSSSQC